ncbi:MAG TPA: DUF4912 domain-containing protein [Coleofasciculaceae cyanobacterium]
MAQASAVFPLPASVPEGTTVKIDGSSSMASINQVLSDRFKSQFPNAQVSWGNSGSEAALKAVSEGTLDLAALGRPLTAEEQAQGLVAVPVARPKIAVFVGADNPFKDSLTGEQFASMFRGEITDWSQVGGAAAPIRFIDRPETSDTRQALPNYPVFKTGPFQPGVNTIRVETDNTDAIVQQLGRDGISYAIADQVINNPAVRVLPLYGTLPTDPLYPFSQTLAYVYKGPNPSPAAAAFLAVATAPGAQQAVAARAPGAGAIAVPQAASSAPAATAVPSPEPSAQVNAASPSPAPTATSSEAPAQGESAPNSIIGAITQNPLWSRWWWLLPAAAGLGILAWWLWGRRSRPDSTADARLPAAAPAGLAAEPIYNSRIILAARSCTAAYAYWEVADAHKTLLKQQGGETLKLRLYDVTDLDAASQPPHSVHEFDCSEAAQDLHLPVPLDDRDYVVELGYETDASQWLPLARSQPIRIPACVPSENGAVPSAASHASVPPASVPPASVPLPHAKESRIILVPRDSQQAYAYWEVNEADKAELRQQGGEKLALRVYEASQADAADQPATLSFRQYDCDEDTQDLSVPIPLSDRDYIAEIGYVSFEGRWLSLAKSDPIRVPPSSAPNWLGAPAKPLSMVRQAAAPVANGNSDATARPGIRAASENRLLLVPRSAEEVYAYWEVSESQKESLRQQGGQRLVLRVYDITGVDSKKNQPPKGVQQFECDETTNDRLVSVPAQGDYIATLGYLTSEGRWLPAARSAPVRIRSAASTT